MTSKNQVCPKCVCVQQNRILFLKFNYNLEHVIWLLNIYPQIWTDWSGILYGAVRVYAKLMDGACVCCTNYAWWIYRRWSRQRRPVPALCSIANQTDGMGQRICDDDDDKEIQADCIIGKSDEEKKKS